MCPFSVVGLVQENLSYFMRRLKSIWTTSISPTAGEVSALLMFRDLADLSQWVVEPPRSSTLSTWRNKNLLSAITLCPLGLGGFLRVAFPTICSWTIFLAITGWTGLLYFSAAINPHIMMRARRAKGRGFKFPFEPPPKKWFSSS